MTTFFDDLEAQLHTAARAQIAVNNAALPPRPSPVRSTLRNLPVLLAIGTSVVVAALALILIRHAPSGSPIKPSGGTPPSASGPATFPHLSRRQRQQIDYVMKAVGATDRQDQACSPLPLGVGDPGRNPSLSQQSPGAATVAALGVLRRPATVADRLPPRIIGAPPNQHVYPDGTIPAVHGVYVRYIRKARHRFGANFYLVPAENVNWRPPLPARCYREQISALRQELPQIPNSRRAGIFALQRIYIDYQQRSTEPYPGVCLLALNGTGNGDGDCGAGGSLSQIDNGQAVAGGAPTGAEVYYGIAPDGVHSITFTFYSKYVHHPVTALVIDNVFIVRNYRGRLGPIATETWRDARGRAIKVIHKP